MSLYSSNSINTQQNTNNVSFISTERSIDIDIVNGNNPDTNDDFDLLNFHEDQIVDASGDVMTTGLTHNPFLLI